MSTFGFLALCFTFAGVVSAQNGSSSSSSDDSSGISSVSVMAGVGVTIVIIAFVACCCCCIQRTRKRARGAKSTDIEASGRQSIPINRLNNVQVRNGTSVAVTFQHSQASDVPNDDDPPLPLYDGVKNDPAPPTYHESTTRNDPPTQSQTPNSAQNP